MMHARIAHWPPVVFFQEGFALFAVDRALGGALFLGGLRPDVLQCAFGLTIIPAVQQQAAGTQYPRDLGQHLAPAGDEMKDVDGEHRIQRAGGKRQPGSVAFDQVDRLAVVLGAQPIQHRAR